MSLKGFLVRHISKVAPATVAAAQEGQRKAHQIQEHLTDEEMTKPDAMKTYGLDHKM
jgi:hypothetical protein